jgi:hypothetical protein
MAELLESECGALTPLTLVGAHLTAGLGTGRSRLARMPDGGIVDTVVARTNCVSGACSRRAGSWRARRGQSAVDIRWRCQQGLGACGPAQARIISEADIVSGDTPNDHAEECLLY